MLAPPMKPPHPISGALLAALALVALARGASAQDLEPRRWTHMPTGMNVAGVTYGYTEGDLAFDPVLEIENATVEVHSIVATYSHAFAMLGKTGRVDVIVPYQRARWAGELSGAPAEREVEGLSDPWVRLSVGLAGAPALKGDAYRRYRMENTINTVVGAALGVMLPLGQYDADKLLNLGQNRFVIRPQLGFVHTRGRWSFELTGSAFFYTDNDDFFGGQVRDQDPVYAGQTHLIHSFRNRSWLSASLGYGWGGESLVNGLPKNDGRGDLLWALSGGIPVGRSQGLKLTYYRTDNRNRTGSDTGSVLLSWNIRF
jgi:hypothetical protein